jgi:hypothetical protein
MAAVLDAPGDSVHHEVVSSDPEAVMNNPTHPAVLAAAMYGAA